MNFWSVWGGACALWLWGLWGVAHLSCETTPVQRASDVLWLVLAALVLALAVLVRVGRPAAPPPASDEGPR